MKDALYVLPKFTRFYRIHSDLRPSTEFNSSGKGGGRFDPIRLSGEDEDFVGVLYIASHYIDAFSETIMRLNDQGKHNFIPADIELKKLAQLDSQRELVFLDLNKVEQISGLMDRGKHSYPKLRQFAEMVLIMPEYEHIDGFVWDGIQRGINGQRVFVVFDKNASKNDFVERISEYLLHSTGFHKVQDAARALGCRIPENIVK
ncbi:RES domain-containing protein [Aliivibrio fischeri]|uniref:RES domain-containing protein n=1 Tax=Aliivibrio fischeri (strain MJ11) TaxID=388396 RepID=B5EWA9_ALIFM|nr:RES domain-containing protein [Aliivibrio fischeri]ACH64782.1 hypothetical protein VFMJ11_B0166 [Aliivibrio fischeri MJ11]MUK37570.1 RES domain-containing protein [Aliivibrio fischeri]